MALNELKGFSEQTPSFIRTVFVFYKWMVCIMMENWLMLDINESQRVFIIHKQNVRFRSCLEVSVTHLYSIITIEIQIADADNLDWYQYMMTTHFSFRHLAKVHAVGNRMNLHVHTFQRLIKAAICHALLAKVYLRQVYWRR